MREVIRAAATETDNPGVAAAIDSVVSRIAQPDALPAAEDSLRPRLVDAVAGEEIAALRRQVGREDERNQELRGELEAAREPAGRMTLLRTLLDDLGLGFGWGALYFTAFPALWRGQTPGKRLLGMRVVRLDGKPMGWWAAFGRFGGYAAGFATGLLGFFQILWDRNRQAIQDKISETVVIRT